MKADYEWGTPRLKAILEVGHKRQQVWKEIRLTDYDPQLVTPDGTEPQVLSVWVNAPSALRFALENVHDLGSDAFYGIMGEYLGKTTDEVSALMDIWEDSLRFFVATNIFQLLTVARDEKIANLYPKKESAEKPAD